MRFVIVGAGRVGLRTARIIDEEGHEVVIIEADSTTAKRVRNEGFEVIEADGSREDVLEKANLDSADAIGGLTGDLNTNFAACMIGKHYGCRTVLRIDEDYREDIYRKFADDVDEIVYPERLGAAGAKTALLGGDFNVVADLTEQLQLTTLTIPDESPIVGQHISELELPPDTRLYAHGRMDERLTIPLPQTLVEGGDSVAVITERDAFDDLKTALLGES